MQILAYDPKELPKGQDYLFEDFSEFEKLKDYFYYPKLSGRVWKITFVDITIKDARSVLELSLPDFVEIVVCLKKDVLIRFLQENGKQLETRKSNWEKFLDMVADFPILIDQKATSELFKRTHGNREKIEEIFNDLKAMFSDVDCIRLSHINAVSIRDDKVYAKDVILALLLHDNELVPLKGSRLSGYRYKDWRKLYSSLLDEVGKEIAFYTLRKAVANLYESKVKYLKNEDVTTNAEVVEVVDVYQLMHAHIAFQTAKVNQSEVMLRIIEGRKQNASLFERTILSNPD